jgi:hypothetical protein
MPQTSTWALPYPAGTQVPNVPADVQALAVAADTAISTVQANLAGQPAFARYERTTATAAQTPITTGANNPVSWPDTITAVAGVTPGGAGNLYFTLAAGTWEVHATVRCSTTLNGTGELSLAWANGATTWAAGNVKAIGGSGSGNVHVTATVVSDGTTAVSASLWQQSGSTSTIQGTGSPFTHATGISFSRTSKP